MKKTKRLLNRDLKNYGIPSYLYRFQLRGVEFLLSRKNCILGDDMGLGKTIQTLSYLQINRSKNILVICPSIVKYNWVNESKNWARDYKIFALESRKTTRDLTQYKQKRARKDQKGNIVIVNYDIVDAWKNVLHHIQFDCIVLDECHYMANPKAKRTKAIMFLSKSERYTKVIALSGTPIKNRPIEFFNVLNLMDQNRFKNYFVFGRVFCAGKRNGFGWDFRGASNLNQLHQLINPFLLRRTKTEVLRDLPPKTRTYIPIEITNQQEYTKAEDDFISWSIENQENQSTKNKTKSVSHVETIAKITALKQIACRGKIHSVVEWAKEILRQNKKLVIFTWHRETIRLLKEGLKEFRVESISGEDTSKKKFRINHEFQTNPDFLCIICQIKAGGIGINLTAASIATFIEYPWSPADMLQAEDRLSRIGQKSNTQIFCFYGKGTIDEHIIKTMKKKFQIITKIVDGMNDSNAFTSIENDIMKSILTSKTTHK